MSSNRSDRHLRSDHACRSPVSMLAVFTLVLWSVFTTAGVAGLRIQYHRLQKVQKTRPPVTAERLNVEILRSSPLNAPKQQVTQPQPTPEPSPPAAPPLPALADPTLNLPFPMPVKEPTRVAQASMAVPSPGQSATAVQRLTLGRGEGDQPAPEYPREAKLAHEEGNVIVQMTIGENGDVTDARVTSPCPWPILNQAAERAVRDTWHFGRGPVRYKDIEFVFQLRQH